MLIDTAKMETVAAQIAGSNRGTKYEKDMFREPSAKKEVLGANVVKSMAEVTDRKEWPKQRSNRVVVPWHLK